MGSRRQRFHGRPAGRAPEIPQLFRSIAVGITGSAQRPAGCREDIIALAVGAETAARDSRRGRQLLRSREDLGVDFREEGFVEALDHFGDFVLFDHEGEIDFRGTLGDHADLFVG